MAYEIDIDIGGTFTDIVCRAPGGQLQIAKLPTTSGDPSQAVLAALRMVQQDWKIPPDSRSNVQSLR